MPKDKDKKRRRYKLSDVSLDELSLVDNGANQFAHVALIKRDHSTNLREEGMDIDLEKSFVEQLKEQELWHPVLDDFEDQLSKAHEYATSFNEVLQDEETQRDLWKLTDALVQSIRNVVAYSDEDMPPDEKRQRVMESLSQFSNKILGMMVGKMSDETGGQAMPEGKKGEGANTGTEKTHEELQKELEQTVETVDTLQSQIEALQQQNQELQNQVQQAGSDEGEGTGEGASAASASGEGEGGEGEGIDKNALPESVKKQLDELETLKKQNEEYNERVQKLEDERETESIKKTLNDECSSVPAEQDKLVSLIKSVRRNAPDQEETLMSVLKSANEAVEKSLVIEKGSEGSGSYDENSAYAQLEKKAEEIQHRDGITKEKAFVKAFDEYPDLARKEQEERTGVSATH